MTSVGLTRKKKVSRKLKPASNVRKPHKFQNRLVEWLLTHAGAGLFADPGAGKSAVILRAILALLDAKVGRKTLIIAPLRVCYKVWPKEAADWEGSVWDRLRKLRVVVLHGPKKDFLLNEDADVFVINFEGLKWLFADKYKKFRAAKFDTLVVDESTKFKNRNTQRFKMMKKILDTFHRRWILTGTPAPKGYLDLFGQIYIIDQGQALSPYITHYRQEYFFPLDLYGRTWALKPGSEERIQKRIAPYIARLDVSDYLELPQVNDIIVRVDLPDEVRGLYDELEAELITELESGKKIVAVTKAVMNGKCAQIANGGIYTSPQHDFENLHDIKTDAVEEIVDELNGNPALVVYDFKHDLSRLRARFPNAPFIGGGVSAKRGDLIIDEWNANKHEVLFVHPQTISHGLNMQLGSAHHIIWHSLTHDFEAYDQLIRRLRRQGSKAKRVFNHLIVATNTVDEVKLRNLRRKDRTQRALLDALKAYTQARKSRQTVEI